MTITPELKHAVERAGDEPVRLEDPETKAAYLVVKEEVYRQLCASVSLSDPSLDEDFRPAEAYPAVDRAFAEGWDDPKMADYDDYESRRP